MANRVLTFEDRFSIFEQLNLHQRRIDTPWGADSAVAYVDLYWPEGRFVLNDLRHTVFSGPAGLKQMFDYAHSVFPLHKWFHTMGPCEISGSDSRAAVECRWNVNWKVEQQGTVSTGTYSDLFEKRDGVWKCLERTSNTDPNWPSTLFSPGSTAGTPLSAHLDEAAFLATMPPILTQLED